jgi:hypothetical protein
MKTALYALALAALLATPAMASPAPVQINQCVIGYEKLNDDTNIGHGVAFTNTAHHVITAVRFNFELTTMFGDSLGAFQETDVGQFSPGVLIDHTRKNLGHQLLADPNLSDAQTYHWVGANPSQETIAHMKVVCTVDAVSFQDGTVWKADR